MATCPHCSKAVTRFKISQVSGNAPGMSNWKCLAFSCPSCDAVLGANLDVMALRAELLAAIKKRP